MNPQAAKNSSIEELKRYMREKKTIVNIDCRFDEGWFASKHLSAIGIAKSYHISADYLIEASQNDEMEPIIVWPVIFLYRHAIELYLKDALVHTGIKIKKTHNILKLFSELENKLIALEKEYKNELNNLSLLPNETTHNSIMQFHSISPESTELRYDDSSLRQEKHQLFANFRYAQEHAHNIKNYFDGLHNILNKIDSLSIKGK